MLVILFLAVSIAGNLAASRDFVSYWATGQQLVHHANPYDRDAISALEHSAGLTVQAVLIMRNPPWALPLAYPLGFLGLRVAGILWSLLLLACLLISVRIVRQSARLPSQSHPLARVRIHAGIDLPHHGPDLAVCPAGAGPVSALPSSPIPSLPEPRFGSAPSSRICFCPFAAALAAWIVVSRSYKLLAGAAAAIALSSAVAFLIDPGAWPDYIRMMRSPAVENEFIPCLADAMRHWLDPQAAWLQYLPAALCCVWALVYFWRRRAAWDWITNSSPLMLVSLLAAPYCWFYDQGLAIPALLDGAYATRSRNLLAALALAILVADIEICGVKVISPLYLWTAPAWLAWYLFARLPAGCEAALPSEAPA